MSVTEIKRTKLSLIAWIEQLSDTNMLSVLEGLKDTKSKNDWWDDLSEVQKQHINQGLDDAENGRTVSSSEFWSTLKNG